MDQWVLQCLFVHMGYGLLIWLIKQYTIRILQIFFQILTTGLTRINCLDIA